MKSLIIPSQIGKRIFTIREHRVMIDYDLAELYQVSTKALNQAVKRNPDRFPEDFVFQLTAEERLELVTNCDHLQKLRFSHVLPYAFTEQGVSMLSSVLRGKRAARVNVEIMRVFVKVRHVLGMHTELAKHLKVLEEQLNRHEIEIGDLSASFKEVIKTLQQWMKKPKPSKIGFHRT